MEKRFVDADAVRRTVDVVLIAFTGLALAAGVTYWVSAAPPAPPAAPVLEPPSDAGEAPDPAAAEYTRRTELVARTFRPQPDDLLHDQTSLGGAMDQRWTVGTEAGETYLVSVICAGDRAVVLDLPDGGAAEVVCAPEGLVSQVGFVATGPTHLAVRRPDGDLAVVGIRVGPG